MKKAIVFIYFSLFTLHFSLAQSDLIPRDHFLKDTSDNVLLRISGNYFFASNNITDQLAEKFFLNGFITEDMKNNSSKHLKDVNRLGAEANGSIEVIFRPDSLHRNIQAYAALRQKNFINASFSNDLFNLFFRGNKNYGGKTAELSDFRFLSLNYNQLAFGLGNYFPSIKPEEMEVPKDDSTGAISPVTKHNENGGTLYLGADVAINAGRSFLNVASDFSSLYTSPDGRFLDGSANATIQTDDSASSHPSYFSGFGTSLDLYIQYSSDESVFNLSAENLGFISWDKWSTEARIDTAFHFEGIDVSQIFDLKDSIKSTTSLDSTFYHNLINKRTEKRITTPLPFKISISFSRFFLNKRIMATIGSDILSLKTLKTINSYARFFGICNYKLCPSDELAFLAAYGGYTSFHCGLSYAHQFPCKIKCEIGSSYLYPMIDFNNGTSQGLWLALSKRF